MTGRLRIDQAVGLLASYFVLGGLIALDLISGPVTYIGLLVVPPFIASVFVGPAATGLVGATAIAAGLVLGEVDGVFGHESHVIRMGFIGFGALAGAGMAAYRERRQRQLAAVQRVAEIAQQALLRPLPRAIGSVGVAVRYVSATEEAAVGGDLYEVLETPRGVRLVIGDVRGKGLGAVQIAAMTLGAFREVAYDEKDLDELVRRVDRSVSRHLGPEEFVTALFVEVGDDATATVVCCGHHPPILVSSAAVRRLPPETEDRPLGLGPSVQPYEIPFGPGDRLFLYTDGVVEARDRKGRFFPLDRHLSTCFQEPLDACVASTIELVARHAGGQLDDDVAVLFLERLRVP